MKFTKKKPLPEFQSEEEERTFWSENDSTEFIEWRTAARQESPLLKPTPRAISSRLPVSMKAQRGKASYDQAGFEGSAKT
jgi:hypothetical protein